VVLRSQAAVVSCESLRAVCRKGMSNAVEGAERVEVVIVGVVVLGLLANGSLVRLCG
jgi:hypothetical protein